MSLLAEHVSDEDWRHAVRRFFQDASGWNREALGPHPGHAGCRCPAHILTEEGVPVVLSFPLKDDTTRKRRAPSRSAPGFAWHEKLLSAAELQKLVFPPVNYIVPGYVPEGLTILAGRPKLGKSWLVLDLSLAVAALVTGAIGGALAAYMTRTQSP